MPRPPILKPVDFQAIFKSAATYRQWLKAAEDARHVQIMEKLRKEHQLEPPVRARLESITRTVNVLVFAEDWCGDVHRHVPVLEKMASFSRRVRTRYVTREEQPEAFKRFLTNGGEAIPKFVFLNHKFTECGNWGAMPEECRRLISRGKAAGDVAGARKRIAGIYESDPNCELTVREILELLDIATCEVP